MPIFCTKSRAKDTSSAETEARDVRHDVVGAARTKAFEPGVFQNSQHAIALDAIAFGEALVIRIRQFERECAGRLQRRRSPDG